MIRRFSLIALLILSITLLCSCGNNSALDNTTEESDDNISSNDLSNPRGKKFIDNFSKDYPDFNLIDYTEASDENNMISLVAVAENKQTGSSSTLFIVDDYGVGQVVLADGDLATYRKEDGLILNDAVISISLDIASNDKKTEIHDFDITVSQEEKEGKVNTIYSSKEEIRTE